MIAFIAYKMCLDTLNNAFFKLILHWLHLAVPYGETTLPIKLWLETHLWGAAQGSTKFLNDIQNMK